MALKFQSQSSGEAHVGPSRTPLEGPSGYNFSAGRAAWEAEKQRQGVGLEMKCSRKKGKERRDGWKILAMES